MPVVGLIDEVPQGLAGVAGVVAIDGGLYPVVDEFLEDLPGHACAEDEEVLADQILSKTIRDAPVSYCTVIISSRADCTSTMTFSSLETAATSISRFFKHSIFIIVSSYGKICGIDSS